MSEPLDGAARIYEERSFRQLVAREVSRASRYRDFFAVYVITSGPDTAHHVSPEDLTGSIASLLRSTDTVGRLHDSVGVLLVNTARAEAFAIAERVRLRLTASGAKLNVGIACFPQDGTTSDALFDSAIRSTAISGQGDGERVTGGDGGV